MSVLLLNSKAVAPIGCFEPFETFCLDGIFDLVTVGEFVRALGEYTRLPVWWGRPRPRPRGGSAIVAYLGLWPNINQNRKRLLHLG